MAGVQLGLEVAFYLYPCGLFVTLLVSQAIYYIRERRQETQASSSPSGAASADDKDADKIRQFYARLVWVFQFLLTLLLASPGGPNHALPPCFTDHSHSFPASSSWCVMPSPAGMTTGAATAFPSAHIW